MNRKEINICDIGEIKIGQAENVQAEQGVPSCIQNRAWRLGWMWRGAGRRPGSQN